MASDTRAQTTVANSGHMGCLAAQNWVLCSQREMGGSMVMESYVMPARKSLEGQWADGPAAEKKFLVPLWNSRVGGFSHGAKGFTEQCPRPLSLPEGMHCEVCYQKWVELLGRAACRAQLAEFPDGLEGLFPFLA